MAGRGHLMFSVDLHGLLTRDHHRPPRSGLGTSKITLGQLLSQINMQISLRTSATVANMRIWQRKFRSAIPNRAIFSEISVQMSEQLPNS